MGEIMKPFKFKKYYKDGTIKLNGGSASKPEYLYGELDGMVSWEEYDKISTSNLSTDKLLKIALKGFNKASNPIKRIEIVNIETNEVLDFIVNKEID